MITILGGDNSSKRGPYYSEIEALLQSGRETYPGFPYNSSILLNLLKIWSGEGLPFSHDKTYIEFRKGNLSFEISNAAIIQRKIPIIQTINDKKLSIQCFTIQIALKDALLLGQNEKTNI